ncbi:MAG: AAA family ATPase [Chthoniobacterales bacterium]
MPAVTLGCDIARANAFTAEQNQPPLPVLVAFGAGPFHQWRRCGSYLLDRAVEENSGALLRSYRSESGSDHLCGWGEILFQFAPKEFILANEHRIVAYAASLSEARRLVVEFGKKYWLEENLAGSFQLINTSRFRSSDTETVSLGPDTILNDETLDLYYGSGFAEWHRDFCDGLSRSKYGLSIFEGPPATGKTSYLRHLSGALKESHRFYFLPPARMSTLADPVFLELWSGQRRTFPDRKFVIFLEDAEAALLTRGNDNRDQVSAILNLSDGLLGDFLRLQIICTINCTVGEIDQALLRPGRLLRHRIFPRLDREQATRLAESLGKTLSPADDYSLAEVFADRIGAATEREQIGFSR